MMPLETESGRRPRPDGTLGDPPGEAVAVPLDEVRAQLERIVSNTGLRHSERLGRFLRYVVEQQLAGKGDQLKESVLAIEIFDRQPSYDSRVDSLVRVEARRLREKLDKYYAAEGRDDPVIIRLPKGSYAPTFTMAAPAAPTDAPGSSAGAQPPVLARNPRQLSIRLAAPLALACVLAAVLLTRWLASRENRPTAPLRRLTSDSGLTYEPALSPDGKLLAYSSDRGGRGDLDLWVQQVPGGRPVRLTDSAGDDVEPTFSPDGTTIAYRSEGENDGIYLVPSLGGKSILLAREGFRPRFSPDGSRIAYWTGERMFRAAKIFIVPSNGGTPVQFRPEFRYAGYPVWSPDGRYIAFVGNRTTPREESNTDNWDWWIAPLDGGPAAPMSAAKIFAKQGLLAYPSGRSHHRIAPYDWSGLRGLIFAARSNDHTNIWRLPVSEGTWRAGGPAQQITFGAGHEDHPAMASDGTLVFSVLTHRSDVWAIPIHAFSGETAGPMVRLASGEGDHSRPVVSRSGKRLAFISNRTGNDEVWVKDLETGRESALTETRQDEISPILSPDSARVAFGYAAPLRESIFVVPFGGGRPTLLCADCGEPRAWLPDGAGLLYQKLSAKGESLIGIAKPSGGTVPLVRSSESALFSPAVSLDGKWMVMAVRTPPNDHRVTIVPLRNGTAAPKAEWISVTEPGPWVNKPRWSSNGNLIYYVSDQDGFVCLWEAPLDPATKKPVGRPKAIAHFHSPQSSLDSVWGLELSVAEDKLVFNLGEYAGNLWLAPASK